MLVIQCYCNCLPNHFFLTNMGVTCNPKLYVITLNVVSTDLERELVHRMNFIEIVEDKVEQGSPGCSWTVMFSCLVDLNFCCLCLFYFDFNLSSYRIQ